jgi:hypothetical protein
MIVFATGFDAMTGALNAIDVRGRDGAVLPDLWAEGPRTYLGIGLAGSRTCSSSPARAARRCSATWWSPSSSTSTGSPTPSSTCADRGLRSIEPTPEAQEAWVAHVAEIAGMTLVSTANSWYMGANVPGKPRVFSPTSAASGPTSSAATRSRPRATRASPWPDHATQARRRRRARSRAPHGPARRYRALSFATTRDSSPVENAPSKRATTFPVRSIPNSHGSVGRWYLLTCSRVPLETLLSM